MTSGHYCDGCAQAYYKCVCDKQEEKNIPKRMNEQIDKLLIEAGAHFGGDGVVYDTFDPKKFAELLIQQCCNAIVNDSRLSDVRTARNGCVRAIKEHFGVEL
jgi:hypothetical protein